jgi:WD40 repeat protein
VLLGATGCVTAPDQDLIAWWDPEGGLKVRSVTGAETFRRMHSRPIHAAAFLPGHHLIVADADGALLVWQYRKDRIRTLPGRHPGCCVIQTTPDRVAVVGTRGIELLDVRGPRPIAAAEFPDGPVTHGAISADGHWLATTSEAGELRIWPLAGVGDARQWHPVAAMRVDGALFECAWVPGTLDLYAAGRRGMYAFTFRPPRPVPQPAGAADRRSSARAR